MSFFDCSKKEAGREMIRFLFFMLGAAVFVCVIALAVSA